MWNQLRSDRDDLVRLLSYRMTLDERVARSCLGSVLYFGGEERSRTVFSVLKIKRIHQRRHVRPQLVASFGAAAAFAAWLAERAVCHCV